MGVIARTRPPLPNPSPTRGEGRKDSSPLAGEEGARRAAVGRRGGKRDLIPLAKRMRREPTKAEARLWSIHHAGRMDGAKFKRQEQIGDYIVDFVCFAERLIVEADGSQHVENGADQVRDAWLKSQDFRILRFWNNDILRDAEAVGEAIHAALRPPLPNPSPARGVGL